MYSVSIRISVQINTGFLKFVVGRCPNIVCIITAHQLHGGASHYDGFKNARSESRNTGANGSTGWRVTIAVEIT